MLAHNTNNYETLQLREMSQYLDWELNVKLLILKEFKAIVHTTYGLCRTWTYYDLETHYHINKPCSLPSLPT
jgi:hypothetical protein